MLYSGFRVMVTMSAVLALFHMIENGSFIYIFFPIVIIIWTIFSFFDENDNEYLRRNGIDPNEISWFFPDYNDYGAVRDSYKSKNRKTYPARINNTNTQYSRYAPQSQYPHTTYNSLEYKRLKDKCKRNFKITVEKEEIKDND